ncbi:UDP-glucose dehydrogenase family protein [Cytobacillus sp. FJAT-54145]|uniref:UDP-glucose 6-dehydrogenase n=1 Tax=Cytobacillus spartinae TaxID=3299023 RepID=A0ABW6KCQ3_9BACI
MRIAVAGSGYVGLVTGVCLAELGYQVICIDVNADKIKMLQSGRSPIYEPGLEPLLQRNVISERLHFTTNPEYAYTNADIIFIAVGTPELKDGATNLKYVEAVSKTIAEFIKDDVIVCTKSTVPVGTNDKIKEIINNLKPQELHVEVVSNPEFLREGSALIDFFHGDRIVIGSNNHQAATLIEQIYLPLNIPIMKTDIKSAEMIKYASNAFLATKISFINEIATLCERVGANIEEVANGIGKDHRIGPYFLQAGIGYGGSCFPKDTKALVQLAGNVQHPFELLKAVIEVNKLQQSIPVVKAKQLLGSLKGKSVAVLGLAFKPNTDDIREAASLVIIQELLAEGAEIAAYDPVAVPNAARVLEKGVTFTKNIKSALYGADIAIIATEWEEIKSLPLDVYSTYMNTPIIVDGRNCYSLEDVRDHPITYVSVGRPAIIKEQSKILIH